MAFLTDITIGQYFRTNSIIHRLDPRTKLISIFALMVMLIASHQIIALLVNFVLIISIIYFSEVPFLLVLRNLRPFVWLFLITLFFHTFLSNMGEPLFKFPVFDWVVTKEGLYAGFIYSTRLAEFVLIAAVLTLTTSPIEITDALERFFSPFKRFGLPIHELILMMTLALRFIPTLISEADKLKNAQISRGATFEGNLIKRIKSVIPLILPLFISVFRRADELALAMDSRCYVGGKGRTTFKELRFSMNDYIALVGISFYLICYFTIILLVG